MSLLNLIFKNKSNIPEKKIIPDGSGIFRTSSIGGICVDVTSLLKFENNRFESFARNSYLKKFIIRKESPKIENYVVMIFNFGIVNNAHHPFSEEEDLSRVVTFQFRDAKKYMYDFVMKDDIRINNIERANSFVFSCLS
jgi:hypothetical protein